MSKLSSALTIAGTDPSGGAGIQADLKTFQELKTYGMSVITSVVAQNTTGVQNVQHLPVEFIEEQLQSVVSDMPVHAFKTGMIATKDMMQVIRKQMIEQNLPYVMDPVMVATSGDVLIVEEARGYLRDQLVPLATIVTPNIPEAEFLTGLEIQNFDDMKRAAKVIVHDLGATSALIKGGHLEGDATDWLYDGNDFHTFAADRIDTTSTHGTGCTYSAAITAYLGKGYELVEAVGLAKKFITAALKHAYQIGHGNGPTNHWGIREETNEVKNY
ncbi:bifunctional hydroxymethylpyrimidine kinase/phosphomethylpyrimidine kinase [Piscibacillus halophilus]|mgnify:CR=1 FL=1|uniref:Hydroxymethylpyrimidine/phosphomethylpyrimidine kinase n=2 Tax=Piscibacillus halophilus TaxID=571933 RepID=A0A1H9GJK5_9BACI|nr:bifunctional hydroxymethylpyrimidine kinase/phosphomethylpyrimidine kinase [Piscibacillus halophilus]SEQ50223.1 hydroxymethylpyrimidine/phosphomethylpyrimidine kinase [Piscibacillus halophilus]